MYVRLQGWIWGSNGEPPRVDLRLQGWIWGCMVDLALLEFQAPSRIIWKIQASRTLSKRPCWTPIADCIKIIRTLLNKSKRVLKLSYDYKNNNNIDLTISSAKPPIFWKEKEMVKQQIFKWKPDNIKKLIFKINEIELLIKKNLNNSVNLVTDFLIEQSSPKTNN